MNKIGFVFSNICILLGAITFVTTSLLNEIFPKLGYLVFQSTGPGSYSSGSYMMDFTRTNTIAGIMLIVGGALAIYFYYKSKK